RGRSAHHQRRAPGRATGRRCLAPPGTRVWAVLAAIDVACAGGCRQGRSEIRTRGAALDVAQERGGQTAQDRRQERVSTNSQDIDPIKENLPWPKLPLNVNRELRWHQRKPNAARR